MNNLRQPEKMPTNYLTPIESLKKYQEEHGELKSLVLDLTTECDNGTCPNCYISSTCEKSEPMSMNTLDEICSAIEKIQGKIPSIHLSGGEPTLVENLPEMTRRIHKITDVIGMSSTGRNLANMEFAEKFVREAKIDEYNITLSSANPDIFNAMRGRSRKKMSEEALFSVIKNTPKFIETEDYDRSEDTPFNYAVQAIVNLTKLKEETEREFKIMINVDMNKTVDLAELISVIEKRGGKIDEVVLQSYQPVGRGENSSPILGLQVPNTQMIFTYLRQAHGLQNQGRISGAEIIDPLPECIVRLLRLSEEPFYKPAATPAFSPRGDFRDNVLILNKEKI
jgi:MoaA/NifB/PqqE/SkfB family radical SAM enzyme